MGQIINRAKEQIVFGLQAGAQIPEGIMDAQIIRALNELYRKSEMVKATMTGIDEVIGTKEYTLPTLSVGNFCRLHSLCRVTYSGSDIDSSVELPPETYTQGLIVPADGSTPYEAITLLSASSRDYVGGLLPYAISGYDSDSHIPMAHEEDSMIAVASKAMQYLTEETGKPWSNPQKALNESNTFNAAVSRIRNKVLRDGTARGLAMKSTQSFT